MDISFKHKLSEIIHKTDHLFIFGGEPNLILNNFKSVNKAEIEVLL